MVKIEGFKEKQCCQGVADKSKLLKLNERYENKHYPRDEPKNNARKEPIANKEKLFLLIFGNLSILAINYVIALLFLHSPIILSFPIFSNYEKLFALSAILIKSSKESASALSPPVSPAFEISSEMASFPRFPYLDEVRLFLIVFLL